MKMDKKKQPTAIYNVQHVDYKDTEFISRFLDHHSRIMPRRKTRLSAKAQRKLALAVKRSRYMALVPYVSR